MNVRDIAAAAALAIAVTGTFADVIHVPDDYPTIQEAIDAAVDGDEIIVAEGTYHENIDFLGKNILVRGTDPTNPDVVVAATIIDGNQAGTVVTMTIGIIRGFTIRNGLDDLAGGVYARNVAEIRDNAITANSAWAGGVYADGDVVISGNTITDNSGRGILGRTRTVVVRNVIAANVGGGVSVWHNCVVRNNTIVGNHASRGGGIYAEDNAAIRSNLIAGNGASGDGGGVDAEYHYGAITSNTIIANLSEGWGSGIYADEGVISSNIVAFSISGFTAIGAGPNAYVDYNCVFGNAGPPGSSGPHDVEADPEFVPGPGGIWTADPTYDWEAFTTTLTDSMAEFTPDELLGGLVNPNTTQDLRFAIVANTQTTITVMGDATPLAYAGANYRVYGFHLWVSSPCISAADPSQPVDFYVGTDIDGEPRLQDCNPDIGADESVGARTVVLAISSTMTTPTIEVSKADCNGLSDGVGNFNRFYDVLYVVELTAEELEDIPFYWIINGEQQPEGEYSALVLTGDHVSAVAEYSPVQNITRGTYFTTIQDAISSYSTIDGDEIVVAPSVYFENVDYLGKDLLVRSVDPTDPDIVATTVIDGNSQDTAVTLSAGVISGFTIRDGIHGVEASGTAVVRYNTITSNYGPGVNAEDNTVIFHNTIVDNEGYAYGAGVAARDDVTVTGNTITGNRCLGTNQGGGVYARDRALVTENVITGNQASAGGGVAAQDDAVVLRNTITDNVGTNRAGGIYALSNSLITNNLITGNVSQDDENGGGGVYAYGTPLITNNAIIANTSLGPGGGVHIGFGADLVGNTVVGNSSVAEGSGVYVTSLHEEFILLHNVVAFNTGGYGFYADQPIENDYNCVFGHDLGNYGGLASPGPHDIIADPLLAGDYIHLLPASPCIDAGDPAYPGQPDETDIDGQPRVADGDGDGQAVVDIGADEVPRPLQQAPAGAKLEPDHVGPVPPP